LRLARERLAPHVGDDPKVKESHEHLAGLEAELGRNAPR
jgi:hypothetical protein